MMATGSVSPVAFWMAGSCSRCQMRISLRHQGSTYLRPHKHIVLLLISNRKLALRLLVVVGKRIQGLDGLALQDRQPELDVGLGVLVSGLAGSVVMVFPRQKSDSRTHKNPRIIRQPRQRHIQRLVHLLAGPLKEPSAPCPSPLSRQHPSIPSSSPTTPPSEE